MTGLQQLCISPPKLSNLVRSVNTFLLLEQARDASPEDGGVCASDIRALAAALGGRRLLREGVLAIERMGISRDAPMLHFMLRAWDYARQRLLLRWRQDRQPPKGTRRLEALAKMATEVEARGFENVWPHSVGEQRWLEETGQEAKGQEEKILSNGRGYVHSGQEAKGQEEKMLSNGRGSVHSGQEAKGQEEKILSNGRGSVHSQRSGLPKLQKPPGPVLQEPASGRITPGGTPEFPFTEQGDKEHNLFTKLSLLDNDSERALVLRVLSRRDPAVQTNLDESATTEVTRPASVQSLRPSSRMSLPKRLGTVDADSLSQRSGAQSHREHQRRDADLMPPRCASSMRVRHMAGPRRRSVAC